MTKEHLTQVEALRTLNMSQVTFRLKAERLGITGTRQGRCLMYKREDIERMQRLCGSKIDAAIQLIERETGKKVQLI